MWRGRCRGSSAGSSSTTSAASTSTSGLRVLNPQPSNPEPPTLDLRSERRGDFNDPQTLNPRPPTLDFRSERREDFYDLSLNVRGCKDVLESLGKYVEKERLDGENKYMAEGHGLQDAEKGCTFQELPPVLHVHLKRFEYDPMKDANVKVSPGLKPQTIN